jgi:hypothetical protein
MNEHLKDVLLDAGYSEVDTAKIISIKNEAERKNIPYSVYYALSKFILGVI